MLQIEKVKYINRMKFSNNINNPNYSTISTNILFILIICLNIFIVLSIMLYLSMLLFLQNPFNKARIFVVFYNFYPSLIPNIAFISAILGSYEKTSKNIVEQTIPFKKFLFSDNTSLVNNGKWDIIDINLINTSSTIDNGNYINSQCNNNHSFNKAKFFKEQFNRIPFLQNFDIIIWLDGTIEIINQNILEFFIDLFNIHPNLMCATILHKKRNGKLENEAKASNFFRYTSTFWNGQQQPYQNVSAQYIEYINQGFQDVGVWVTCFIVWNMHHPKTLQFLDKWYLQNLKYTTQDQVSFPFVIWDMNLSNSIYTITKPSNLFIKREHNQ